MQYYQGDPEGLLFSPLRKPCLLLCTFIVNLPVVPKNQGVVPSHNGSSSISMKSMPAPFSPVEVD